MTRSNWIVLRIAEVLQTSGDAALTDPTLDSESLPIFQQTELAEAMAKDLSLMSSDEIVKILQHVRRFAPSVQARVLAMLFEVEPPKLSHSRHLIFRHSPAVIELILMQDNVHNAITSQSVLTKARLKDALPEIHEIKATSSPRR